LSGYGQGVAPTTFTASDGVELAADRLPGAGPRVVLLHAGVADRRAWSGVGAALADRGFEVIAYDRRGFGETPASGAPDHVADLREVLRQAGDGPAWLVGNSQGGRIALDLALTEPARVAGLVLIAPAVSGAPDPDDDELDPDTLRIDAAIEAADERDDADAVNRLEAWLWLDGPVAAEGRVSGPARELFLEMNAIALAADWPEDAGPDEPATWEHLGEIAAPATVVWGELDLPFFGNQCRELAERLGDVRAAIELPGVAHLPGLEDPGGVAELIAEAVSG
jgi:pimeloyl-ACP methyl ester carboxylesterase